jgi:hypothetical protein
MNSRRFPPWMALSTSAMTSALVHAPVNEDEMALIAISWNLSQTPAIAQLNRRLQQRTHARPDRA